MSKIKTFTTYAGAIALAFALAAAPAAFSQQDEPPMGEKHQHGEMHGQEGHGQAHGEMPEGHAEMMEEHKAKMAEHKAAMEAHMARMEELIADMNQATGDAKTDAVAAVINEMWSHHQSMREGMGMMGAMGCMGMMGGHGKAGGQGMAGCSCSMHGGEMGEAHAGTMHGEGGCMQHPKQGTESAQGAAGGN